MTQTNDDSSFQPSQKASNGHFESLSDYIQNHLDDDTPLNNPNTAMEMGAYAEDPSAQALMGFGAQQLYQSGKKSGALRKGGQLYSTDAQLAETHFLKQFSNEALRWRSLKREYSKALNEVNASLAQYGSLPDQAQPQLQHLRARQQHLQAQLNQLDESLKTYNPFQALSNSPMLKIEKWLSPLNSWWHHTVASSPKQQLKQHHQQFARLQQLLSEHIHSPNELPPELLEQLLIEYDRQMSQAEQITAGLEKTPKVPKTPNNTGIIKNKT